MLDIPSLTFFLTVHLNLDYVWRRRQLKYHKSYSMGNMLLTIIIMKYPFWVNKFYAKDIGVS